MDQHDFVYRGDLGLSLHKSENNPKIPISTMLFRVKCAMNQVNDIFEQTPQYETSEYEQNSKV